MRQVRQFFLVWITEKQVGDGRSTEVCIWHNVYHLLIVNMPSDLLSGCVCVRTPQRRYNSFD